MALVLLVLNNLIYNWVFLPQYYKEHPRTFFITPHQVTAYFRWMPGALITGFNITVFFYFGDSVQIVQKVKSICGVMGAGGIEGAYCDMGLSDLSSTIAL